MRLGDTGESGSPAKSGGYQDMGPFSPCPFLCEKGMLTATLPAIWGTVWRNGYRQEYRCQAPHQPRGSPLCILVSSKVRCRARKQSGLPGAVGDGEEDGASEPGARPVRGDERQLATRGQVGGQPGQAVKRVPSLPLGVCRGLYSPPPSAY